MRLSGKGSELPSALPRRRPQCSFTYRKRTARGSHQSKRSPLGSRPSAHFGLASWHCLGLTRPLSGHALLESLGHGENQLPISFLSCSNSSSAAEDLRISSSSRVILSRLSRGSSRMPSSINESTAEARADI